VGIFGTPQDQVDLDDLKERVTRLEAAVAALQQAAATPVPYGSAMATPAAAPDRQAPEPSWMAEVRALVARDSKIEAIKLYRERTGLGLKEAKDAIDALP
jgi:large subunit ribosomal protein L7/L12